MGQEEDSLVFQEVEPLVLQEMDSVLIPRVVQVEEEVRRHQSLLSMCSLW